MTTGETRATEKEWGPGDLAVRSRVFPFDTQIHQNLLSSSLLSICSQTTCSCSQHICFSSFISSKSLPFSSPTFLLSYSRKEASKATARTNKKGSFKCS